jgi:gluconolactonase
MTGSMTEYRTRVMTEGLQFPEGPVAMDDGSVLVVEIKRGTITRCLPDGSTEVVATPGGGPNGMAIGPDGHLYVCNNGGFGWREIDGMTAPGHQADDYTGGSIQRVDIATGAVETLYTHCDGHALRGPNDIVFDAHGGFWFTDLGKSRSRDSDNGGLYYATADGSSITCAAYPLNRPNGVGLSPDGSTVYVAETSVGRLWKWEIESPGVVRRGTTPLAHGTLLHGFDGYQMLDSLAVDGDGNVCVATLVTGAVSVVSPAGELLEQVTLPTWDAYITNVCFGGPDLRTAYVTSSGWGLLYAVEWPRPGLRLEHQA